MLLQRPGSRPLQFDLIRLKGRVTMERNLLLVVLCGGWCSEDGRHCLSRAQKIITPNGTRMEGVYSLHSFLYVIPSNEAQAGQEVSMQLLNETAVNARVGAPTAPSKVWRRCTETTS
jgi:hypothetical protein